MSLKKTIFAAAAVAITATAGAADTYFENGRVLDAGDQLELGLITTDGNGMVEIYDYANGEKGALLGVEMLNAGANPDVKVDTGLPATQDVIAVVTINGEVAAEKFFEIDS